MEFSAPIRVFRSSIARPTDPPVYASTSTSRCWLQDLGPRWIRSFLSCRGGIELECADLRRRVTSPALSVTEWVPSSAMATFLQAPLRSRTVGFPESGSDLGWLYPPGLPDARRAKVLGPHTLYDSPVCQVGSFRLRGWLILGSVSEDHPGTPKCPEPLCPTPVSRR